MNEHVTPATNNNAPDRRSSTAKLKPRLGVQASATNPKSSSKLNPDAAKPKTSTNPKPAAANSVPDINPRLESANPKPNTGPKPGGANTKRSAKLNPDAAKPKTSTKPNPGAANSEPSTNPRSESVHIKPGPKPDPESANPKPATKPNPDVADTSPNTGPKPADANPKPRAKPGPSTTNSKPCATSLRASAANSKRSVEVKPDAAHLESSHSASNVKHDSLNANHKPTNIKTSAADIKPGSNINLPNTASSKPSVTTKSASSELDEIYQRVIRSIEAAGKAMSTSRVNIEKAKASQEDRNNVVNKAGEVVSSLLAPGRQVVHFLAKLGAFFPPCTQVCNTLAALIKLEIGRRESDVRVSVIHFDLARALAPLGALSLKSRPEKSIADSLRELLKTFKSLMEEFGHFCEAYYGTKALEPRLKHLLHWKNNKESLDRFADRIEQLRRDLIGLLSQQAVQQPSKHVEILAQLESQLSGNRAFYSSIRDEKEDIVEAFLSNHGGEAAVRMNGNLLNRLATSVGESVTQGIANAIKETAETTLKQSQASFALKLRYTLDQWVSGSQQKVQTDTNPEAKAIWKNTAAMESIVDSQQLVGGVNRYYDTQFRKYQVDNPHAEHNDAWTRSIISNVHLHSAIGGAIGDDGCGNITVIDFNKFIHKKPAKLSVPQWVAYGAYGWGADNQLYRDEVNKIYAQLEKHMATRGARATLVNRFLSETQEPINEFMKSVHDMHRLDPATEAKMRRLRDDLRASNETKIKTQLMSVNHKINYSILAPVTGSERIEETFCVFAWILVSRYLELVDKSEFPSEVVGEAMQSVVVLTGAMQRRVKELVTLWRRRGLDVDAQIQSYANGLFEGHYRKYRQQEFDADLGRSAEYEYGWNVEGGGVVDGFWADGATSEYDSGHYSPDNGVSRYAVGKSATYGYDEQETYLLEEDEDASDELGDSDGYQDPYTREDEDPGSGPDREDDEDQEPYIQEDDDLGSGEDGENDDLSQDQDIDSEPVGDSYDDQETYLREDDNSSIGVNEDDDGVLEAQLQEDEDVEAPLEGDDDGDQELYLQEEQDAGRGPERDDEEDDEAYLQTDEDIGAELAGNDGDSEADNDEVSIPELGEDDDGQEPYLQEDQDDGADNDEYAGDQLGDDDDDQGPDLLDQDAQPGENDGDGQVPYFGNAFGEPGGYEDGTQGSYFATDDGNEDCGQCYDDDDQGPGFYPQGDDEGAYDGQGPDDYPQEYDYGGNVGDHW